MADEKVGALEPHCLDDAFHKGRQFEKQFQRDDDVRAAFRKAERAYERQRERMNAPNKEDRPVGPLPNQCARQAFLEALDLEPKRRE
jgi:hypothetical protein